MSTLKIFGEEYEVVNGNSREDKVDFKDGKIHVNSKNIPSSKLIKEALSDYLYAELLGIYKQLKKEEKLEILGDVKFDIKEKIDDKKNRIAKLKHNKITVKLNAISLPEEALKFIIVHEMAHLITKKHNSRFWNVVEIIYPEYEVGKDILDKYENDLKKNLTLI